MKLKCPRCGEEIWDYVFAYKLNKCHGCGLVFDSEEKEENDDE